MLLMLTKLASQERCCAAGKLAADSDLLQQSGQTAAEKQSTSDGKEQIESSQQRFPQTVSLRAESQHCKSQQ